MRGLLAPRAHDRAGVTSRSMTSERFRLDPDRPVPGQPSGPPRRCRPRPVPRRREQGIDPAGIARVPPLASDPGHVLDRQHPGPDPFHRGRRRALGLGGILSSGTGLSNRPKRRARAAVLVHLGPVKDRVLGQARTGSADRPHPSPSSAAAGLRRPHSKVASPPVTGRALRSTSAPIPLSLRTQLFIARSR